LADSTTFDLTRYQARAPEVHADGRPDVASSLRTLALESAAAPGALFGPPLAASGRPAVTTALHSEPPPASLFDELPDAVLRFDRHLVVVYANAVVERATGLPRHAFLGRTLAEVEHFSAYAPLWQAKLEACFDTLDGRSFKFTYDHPTGSRTFEVRLMLEWGGPGPSFAHQTGLQQPTPQQPSHLTALVRDVTVPRTAMRATRARPATFSPGPRPVADASASVPATAAETSVSPVTEGAGARARQGGRPILR